MVSLQPHFLILTCWSPEAAIMKCLIFWRVSYFALTCALPSAFTIIFLPPFFFYLINAYSSYNFSLDILFSRKALNILPMWAITILYLHSLSHGWHCFVMAIYVAFAHCGPFGADSISYSLFNLWCLTCTRKSFHIGHLSEWASFCMQE